MMELHQSQKIPSTLKHLRVVLRAFLQFFKTNTGIEKSGHDEFLC